MVEKLTWLTDEVSRLHRQMHDTLDPESGNSLTRLLNAPFRARRDVSRSLEDESLAQERSRDRKIFAHARSMQVAELSETVSQTTKATLSGLQDTHLYPSAPTNSRKNAIPSAQWHETPADSKRCPF